MTHPLITRLAEVVAYFVGAALVAVAAIVGGSLVKGHFGPKADLCNTYGGQYAQMESSSVAANCGLDSFLTQMAGLAYWLGVAGLIALAVLAIAAAVAATRPSAA